MTSDAAARLRSRCIWPARRARPPRWWPGIVLARGGPCPEAGRRPGRRDRVAGKRPPGSFAPRTFGWPRRCRLRPASSWSTAGPLRRFLEGRHEPGRWIEIIDVGRRLNRALAGVGRPDFLERRSSPWAEADRMTWDETPIGGLMDFAPIARLAAMRRAIDTASQVIHGDLCGNVLFSDREDPAVIDFSPYWRPADYAVALVVGDAIVSEEAPAGSRLGTRRRAGSRPTPRPGTALPGDRRCADSTPWSGGRRSSAATCPRSKSPSRSSAAS